MAHVSPQDTRFPESDCDHCDARCCRYIATEIDRPRSKRDYDHIRWFLLHRNVAVYVDRSGQWFVEFRTPCRELQADHRCRSYARRPDICRKHNTGDEKCERDEATPYRMCFNSAGQFEKYLTQRGIDWQFKAHRR